MTNQIDAQMATPIIPVPHPSRSDEIQDPQELGGYFRWLSDRIKTDRLSPNALPPRSSIFSGHGSFYCSCREVNGEDRYWLSVVCSDYYNCPISYRQFIRDSLNKFYRIQYVAVRRNTIFPVFGSLYCLDEPNSEKIPTLRGIASAFRISDSDIPTGLTLQRRSIVFPICDDPAILSPGNASQYDGWNSDVYIVGYGPSPTPSEGPRVKITNTLMSPEEHKLVYEKCKLAREEFIKRNPNVPPEECPFVEIPRMRQGWYKIGDVVPFQTVAHKIINIVLPDTEDCRIVHRKNNDGSITELKCCLSGWVELNPTPIPLNKD